MNKLFYTATLVALCCWWQAGATNFYFSSTQGNDGNPVNSMATPWASITKLNTLILQPADTVFLMRGDTFRGQITVLQSGSAAFPIVFSAYGNGNLPVVSGAAVVSGWVSMGTYYECTMPQTVFNFFWDNREMTLARFPNSGYIIQSGSTTSVINSAQLTQTDGYWNGAKVCVRTCQWVWETATVNASATGSLTLAVPLQISPIGNYGFFMYNKFAALDTVREWYYNAALQKLYFIPPAGSTPAAFTAEASVINNGISIGAGASNITIQNLWFDKHGANGIVVVSNSSVGIKVHNCVFTRQFLNGIQLRGYYHAVSGCTFRGCDGKGIEVAQGGKSILHHNQFSNIGMYLNSGTGKQTNLEAIGLQFVDSVHIHHNQIDSVGYTGIHADGTRHLVEKNILSNCMLLLNDGAPLKTYGGISDHIIYRNNFVSATPGNTEGTYNATFLTPGIYFDFNSNTSLIEDNTIYNHPDVGIFLNAGTHNITATRNVVYGADYGVYFNPPQQPTPMHNQHVTNNTLFALDPAARLIRQSPQPSTTNDYEVGIIDSNYLFNPYAANVAVRYGMGPPVNYTFTAWQATGYDVHSVPSFVNWTMPVNHSVLFMNPSDSILQISLGTGQYYDLDQNEICGILTLPPFTSKVLIDAQTICSCTFTPVISGNTMPCANNTSTYSIPDIAGSTYIWTVTGGTIVSGQGQNQILVQWNNGAAAGTVSVEQTVE